MNSSVHSPVADLMRSMAKGLFVYDYDVVGVKIIAFQHGF